MNSASPNKSAIISDPGSLSDGPLSFYRKRHEDYSDQLKNNKKTQRIFVLLRLALFALMVFLPLVFIKDNGLVAALIFLFLLTAFLSLVKRFVILEKHGRYLSCLLDINKQEIESQSGDYSSHDDGGEFTDPDHKFSFDLDIFGADSLFQYINRCCTLPGKEKLAAMLCETAGDAHDIYLRQNAFQELSRKPDLCQHFLAAGRMHKYEMNDRANLLAYVNSPSRFLSRPGLVLISILFPVLTLGTLAFVIAGLVPVSIFTFLFFLQLGITGLLYKQINGIHGVVTRRLGTLKKYSELLDIIENAGFDSTLLKSVQGNLNSMGQPPSAHIKKLSKIVEAFDNRLNIIAALLLNGLFLWDINCVLMLERWNRQHRNRLSPWLDSIFLIDAYISFSVFTFNNNEFVFPQPVMEGPAVSAVSLGHPLIPRQERVCNDLSIDAKGKFIIITGANMAGKSTFLRTTGVALVLAMAGAPVCAGEFQFRITEIYTSMRTNDSLSRNESYFYAELKRLKNIFDTLKDGKQVFVILDEILKGTNSTDKQRGSVALLEKLISLSSTGIVATHDLSLADLSNRFPDCIENKCFEVEIEGDTLIFDYRLRDGVTRKMNAMILMGQMGLLLDEQTHGPG